MAAALPAKVTKTAMAMMIGKSTGSMEICELKIDRPIWRASRAPAENPAMPPTSANSRASAKKIAETEIARAEGLHQTDFNAALEDGRGHGGRNRESGSKKGGERDQQHQPFDAREHSAFVLRDLADLLRVRMRDDFL